MCKKVYLLGAGFTSLYGGPSTYDITVSLAQMSKVNGLISESLFDYYGEDYNFETILASLETIINYKESEKWGRLLTAVEPALFHLKRELNEEDVKNAYIESINIIIDKIAAYEANRSAVCDELVFKHFSKHEQNHIYSLNYDRIVPKIWDKFNISFSDGTINKTAFRSYIQDLVASGNLFFNLHGNIYLNQRLISLYDVFQEETPQKLHKLMPVRGGNPGESLPFSPIIAGYSKTQRLITKPFSTGLAAFAIDLQTCDEFEIIGYSFWDDHINELLKSYFDFGEKRLTIVGRFDDLTNPNCLDEIQGCLSVFYPTIPQNPQENDGMYQYTQMPLRIYKDGVEKYLRTMVSMVNGED